MANKLHTIYDLLSDYSEEEIDIAIGCLTEEERAIVTARYGSDLHNPKPSDDWNRSLSNKFYGRVLPKIRSILAQNRQKSAKVESLEVVDHSRELVQMVISGMNHVEICEQLGIDACQLYKELLNLKNMGIEYSRKYYSDGSIKYDKYTALGELKSGKSYNQNRTIITASDENEMKLLVISDLHFGNEQARLDLVDRAYDYCIKHGINIILCGGDIIDGTFTQGKQSIPNVFDQVEYFIRNYPHDKNILTFAVGGDHDLSALKKHSLSLVKACENHRQDVIISGFNNAFVHIKNDKIQLYHNVGTGTILQTDAPIVLHGHFHKFLMYMQNGSLNIALPALSNINQPMPGALELDIKFDKGRIATTFVKHICFKSKRQDLIMGEFEFDLIKGRNIVNAPLKNVEDYRVTPTSKMEGDSLGLSEEGQSEIISAAIEATEEKAEKSLVNRPLSQNREIQKEI